MPRNPCSPDPCSRLEGHLHFAVERISTTLHGEGETPDHEGPPKIGVCLITEPGAYIYGWMAVETAQSLRDALDRHLGSADFLYTPVEPPPAG